MKYDPQKHHRRSIRLKGYDYTRPGAYFVTICTQDHSCILGEIGDDEMYLSVIGQVAYDYWFQVPEHFSNVEVTPFIVMPNHVHVIITIHEQPGRGVVSTPRDGEADAGGRETLPLPDLGQIIGYYKYQTTKQVNLQSSTPGTRLWQRNYFERIVRSQRELRRFTGYILSNPQRWQTDQLNPSAPPNKFNQKLS